MAFISKLKMAAWAPAILSVFQKTGDRITFLPTPTPNTQSCVFRNIRGNLFNRKKWIPGTFSRVGISSHHWCGSSSPSLWGLLCLEISPVMVVRAMPTCFPLSHLTDAKAWPIAKGKTLLSIWKIIPSSLLSLPPSLLCGPPLLPLTHSNHLLSGFHPPLFEICLASYSPSPKAIVRPNSPKSFQSLTLVTRLSFSEPHFADLSEWSPSFTVYLQFGCFLSWIFVAYDLRTLMAFATFFLVLWFTLVIYIYLLTPVPDSQGKIWSLILFFTPR